MATKIKVHGDGHGKFMHLEINGGASGEMGHGTHEFSIGQHGAMVQYLSIRRLAKGKIQVLAETGDVYVEVDGGHAKHIKKGKVITLPSSAKRAAVRERPHR